MPMGKAPGDTSGNMLRRMMCVEGVFELACEQIFFFLWHATSFAYREL